MAIYQDESELSRQGTRVQFRGMKGFKKGVSAVMGYDDRGKRNGFGKFMDMAAFGGLPGSRFIAKGMAGGTDADTVMDETYDEYVDQKGAGLKFGLDAIKTASMFTGAGAVTNLATTAGKIEDLASTAGDVADLASATDSRGDSALIKDALDTTGDLWGGTGADAAVEGYAGKELQTRMDANKYKNAKEAVESEVEGVNTEELTAEEGVDLEEVEDLTEEVEGSEDTVEDVDTKTEGETEVDEVDEEGIPELSEEVKSEIDKDYQANRSVQGGKKKKATKKGKDISTDKALSAGVGLIDSGLKYASASKEYYKAGDKEVNKLLKRTRKHSKNYL